ncbi:MAG: hydrolase, alpha/beta fold family [Ferruginibacter sp.]|uniref:alpha/beta fold hydrolase n=1 Tax=Ferruginibacter sp. TaxID=1940288 RepID=UPI002657D8E8|nr:alpha/beta hydrolase [Ferruginibacter sp.]MDB5276662.1 hydrolase, alpha/beta fold family [Ferruginibacter sp.]
MQKQSFTLTCADGHLMPVYAWLPDAPPVSILHIAHGMAEYAERYNDIATIGVQQGIAVYAHDQRAHGKAVAGSNALGLGEKEWFNKQVDDLHLLMLHLKKIWPERKLFLLGHSMGSFLCQRFFQLHGNSIDGLILSATNGKKDPLMGAGILIAGLQMKLLGANYRSKLINKLSFGKFNNAFKPNRTTFDWLSRDTKTVDDYIANPLCGFVCSAQFFYYFFKGIQAAFDNNIQSIPTNIPVYAFAGDKDPVGLEGKGFLQLISNWKAAGVKDISYKLYPGGRHEMMNEINRAEVLQDLLQWINNHT